MALRKAPSADLKQRRPVYLQIGLLVSLGLTILAFTVHLPESEAAVYAAPPSEVIELEDVPPTRDVQPPPPPPPAPPPPAEVPDQQAVEDEIVDLVLDLRDTPPEPPAPPVRQERIAPPPPPDVPPPPPPPVPEVETEEDKIFVVAEVQPELIGGLPGLQSRVEYPEFARRAGVEGQVVVQFVVDERGNVVDPVVLRSPNDLLAEAALKAVRESRFKPGQQRGRPVKVRFAVPVTFRLH